MYDVIFRLDANSNCGAGHFQRSFALIQRLLERPLKLACIGTIESPFYDVLLNKQIDVLTPDNLISDKHVTTRCLILDHYASFNDLLNTNIDYQHLVIFEDLDDRSFPEPCVVINALGDEHDLLTRYPKATIFAGLRYQLFRQDILAFKENIEFADTQKDSEILLSLGATDQSYWLRLLGSHLVTLLDDIHSEFGLRYRLRILSPVPVEFDFPCELNIGFDPKFIQRAAKAALVICASGQSLLEMNYLGLRPIGLVIADNQLRCAQALANNNVIDLRRADQALDTFIGAVRQRLLAYLKNELMSDLEQTSLFSEVDKGIAELTHFLMNLIK